MRVVRLAAARAAVSATLPAERSGPAGLYAQTSPPAPATPPLEGTARARIAIVGAGYTGLSTALHLALAGEDVVVLEAHEPGWGAAGRNGGQVNPGLKYEPADVLAHLGTERGERLVALAAGGPDYLFELVARHGLSCEAQRGGTLRAAFTEAQTRSLEGVVAQWHARGVPLRMLDAHEVAARTGAGCYRAALFDPRGGSLNPLAYARGLAGAAIAAGARIHGRSRACTLERSGGRWRIGTERGTLEADAVLLATDGYTDDLWPGLRRSVVPIYSAIVATEPLDGARATAVMPTRAVAYEVGSITIYYRRDAAGRLLMGGRGPQRTAAALGDYRHLVAHARRLWPALGATRWTHWWNGQFALTPDFYPRLHAPAPGLLVALGYSGRGVALATILGRELASALAGRVSPAELPLPVTPIRPIHLHRFWRLGVAARVAYGRVRDRLAS